MDQDDKPRLRIFLDIHLSLETALHGLSGALPSDLATMMNATRGMQQPLDLASNLCLPSGGKSVDVKRWRRIAAERHTLFKDTRAQNATRIKHVADFEQDVAELVDGERKVVTKLEVEFTDWISA